MFAMQLRINDKVYYRFLRLLSKFNNDEAEKKSEYQAFISITPYLQKELDEMQSGKENFISQTESKTGLDQFV